MSYKTYIALSKFSVRFEQIQQPDNNYWVIAHQTTPIWLEDPPISPSQWSLQNCPSCSAYLFNLLIIKTIYAYSCIPDLPQFEQFLISFESIQSNINVS